MNIPDKAYEAADQAGDEAYIIGGAPEDVAKAAVKAAAPFIAAQAFRDFVDKVGGYEYTSGDLVHHAMDLEWEGENA